MKIAGYLVEALALASGFMAAVIPVSATAEAQQQAITLSCKGTMKTGSEDQQVTMGIVVNFTTRRVQGLQAPGFFDYPLAITAADDAMITFRGSNSLSSTLGTIDRVNGDVDATMFANNQSSIVYALKCRPAQRIF